MTFTVREPGLEIQFLQHDPDSASTLPISAGSIVKMVGNKLVDVCSATSDTPVGFLMQTVKAAYTDVPTGFRFRSDFGATSVFKGDPVGVASYGIYETTLYTDVGGNGIAAGTKLYLSATGTCRDTDPGSGYLVAIALQTLTTAQAAAGATLLIKALI
jgi:predicted RecA/RadA family phage recombinase